MAQAPTLTSGRREQERIRMEAAAMFEQGLRQRDVVQRFGVAKSTASKWEALWKAGGREALRARRASGRPRRLAAAEWARLEQELIQGPAAHGYRTELWTLSRVAALIAQLFGVRYHISHVWRLLGEMNWTNQKPARQAKKRDEAAIRAWREQRWPRLKRGRSATAKR